MRIDQLTSTLVLAVAALSGGDANAQAATPVLATPTSVSQAAANHREGPRSLLITYRAEPGKRAAFRDHLAGIEMARLAAWKRQGVIAGYQLLFKPYADGDTWDAMLVLRFARFSDEQRWFDLENAAPGGLAPAGLALGHPINTYFADADWEAGSQTAADDEQGVFYVIPYEYRAEGEYRSYMDGYVMPQIMGWMREGVLSGYRIFMNRYPVGKPWDSLFVLRYRDLDAFGRREEVIAKVRAALQSDAAWKAWSDKKAGVRTEAENVIAKALPSMER